jgi:hypothetical protein
MITAAHNHGDCNHAYEREVLKEVEEYVRIYRKNSSILQ